MSRGKGIFHKLCSSHHKKKYGMPYGNKRQKKQHKILHIPNNKCSICKWVGPCDRHRIIYGQYGGEYKEENLLILCPNCHRLLHLGRLVIEKI